MIIVECSFSKSSLLKMFSVHTKTKKLAFSNSFGLKSVLEKLSFCYRLEWTVSLAVKIKLPFQSTPNRAKDSLKVEYLSGFLTKSRKTLDYDYLDQYLLFEPIIKLGPISLHLIFKE